MAKEKIKAVLDNEKAVTENSSEARELYNQSRYGSLMQSGKVHLSLLEALYLVEKNKIQVFDKRNKEIEFTSLMKKAKKKNKRFSIKYSVFKDIRNRGYVIKTALKFGADFRVYARGVKPGEDHAKWIVYPVHESEAMTWHEFAAKNRVAHSTKKKLMMGVVDDEGDVSYWEIRWLKP
jgi:tRNA-intron endonuclease